MLQSANAAAEAASVTPRIIVIEDEYLIREGLCGLIIDAGLEIESFASCESFLESYTPRANTCVLLDVHFPGMGGLELLARIRAMSLGPPVIIVSGSSEIAEVIQSLKGGAVDFLEKPVVRDALLQSVRHALGRSRHFVKALGMRDAALGHIARLTKRQHQIMTLILAGQPNKNIACDLGISRRTVETHRAAIMQKTGADSLPALARLVMYSSGVNEDLAARAALFG